MSATERRHKSLDSILREQGRQEGLIEDLQRKVNSMPLEWTHLFTGHRAEISDHIEKIENKIDERLSRIEEKIEELLKRPSLAEITGEKASDIASNYEYIKELRKDRKQTAVSIKNVTIGTLITGALAALWLGIKSLAK